MSSTDRRAARLAAKADRRRAVSRVVRRAALAIAAALLVGGIAWGVVASARASRAADARIRIMSALRRGGPIQREDAIAYGWRDPDEANARIARSRFIDVAGYALRAMERGDERAAAEALGQR